MRNQAAIPFPRPVPQPAGPPPVADHPQFRKLRESLHSPLAAQLSSATELKQSLEKKQRAALPTMLASFDRVLGGGIQRGKLTELVGRRSSGRFGICLATLAAITQCGEAAALVDHGDHLDPQIAAGAGVDLPRLLWVRPETIKHAVAVADMLITTGFPLVVLDLGIHVRGRRVADASWVRLARSAEAYGAALLISTPFSIAGAGSSVVISAHSGIAVWKGKGKSPRLLTRMESTLKLEKHRRAITGRCETLRLRYDEAIVAPEHDADVVEVSEQTIAASA